MHNVLNGYFKASDHPIGKEYNMINGNPFIGQIDSQNRPSGIVRLIDNGQIKEGNMTPDGKWNGLLIIH